MRESVATREATERAARYRDPLPDRVDVVVVGAGIAGVSAAYHLASEGVSVAVLEERLVGGAATGGAVGALTPPLRQPYHETVHFRGEEAARSIWQFALRSCRMLGEFIEERGLAEEASLDLTGGWVLAQADTGEAARRSYAGMRAAGLPVEWLEKERIAELTGGVGFVGGYRVEGGGCLDPVPTTIALADAARERGARVIEGVRVEDASRDGPELRCDTVRGSVSCEMVVYASHLDCRRFSPFLGDEIVPVRSQGLATEPVEHRFRGAFSTHWKANQWRQAPSGSLVLGGWRHDAWERGYYRTRPEVDEELQAELQSWFEAHFPGVGPVRVASRWSGIMGWTADQLPLVGPIPGRTGELVAAGFCDAGLSLAFECGRVIARIVTGGEPLPGTELLNPRRFT